MREEEQTKWRRQPGAGVPFRELSLGPAGSDDTSWWFRFGGDMGVKCSSVRANGPKGGGRAGGPRSGGDRGVTWRSVRAQGRRQS